MNMLSSRFLLLFALLAVWAPTVAQTIAPPVIEGAVTWTAAGSPYLVTSALLVPPTASLTIEPGVLVHVAEGTDIVVDGQLVAHGSTEAAVVITSDSGAPGANWGNLLLAGGGGTFLRHVEIAYGGGVLIQASSPVLFDVTLHHNVGPAITIDLASSPTGSGLVAYDNEVNGIVVAAGNGGRISGDVVWALKGIPYVVRSMIDIGAQTFAFDPDRVTLAVGASVQLQLRLSELAVSQLAIELESMAPSLVSVQPTTATFESGEDEATVMIEGRAPSPEPVAIIAYRDGMPSAPAAIRVLDLQGLTLLPSVAEVTVGGTVDMTVRAPTPAPGGGIEVAIAASGSCPSCVVPVPTVVIPANQTEASFVVEGAQIGSVVLRAQAPGFAPAESQVTVRQPFVRMPISFIVAPGASRSLQVELSDVAPTATTVNLVAADPSLASIPATVTIPAGQLSAPVSIQGGAAAGETLLTASAAGFEASSTHLWVRNMQLVWDAGNILPEAFEDDARVYLTGGPAPPGGLLASLTSSPSGVAQVLASSAFIPAGQTQSSLFRIRGASSGSANLLATADGVQTGSRPVNVVEPMRPVFSKSTVAVGVGLRTHVNELALSLAYGAANIQFSPRRPVSLRLINGDQAFVTAPTHVTITPGAGQRIVQLEGLAPTQAPVQLMADIDDYVDVPGTVDVQVVTPGFRFVGLDLRRAVGSPRDAFHLEWDVPGAEFPQAALGAMAVPVAILPEPAGIVDGIFANVSGGSPLTQLWFGSNQSFSAFGHIGSPTVVGSYRIRAGADDLESVSSQVLVADRFVRLSSFNNRVSPGLRYSCAFVVSRELADGPYSPPFPGENLSVNLTSSHPEVIVPSPVTLVGTSSSQCVEASVQGAVTGSVQIAAQTDDPNYQVEDPLELEVVPASLRFFGLDDLRERGSPFDDFGIAVCTGASSPNDFDCNRGVLLSNTPVALRIVNATPMGVVAGVTASTEISAGDSSMLDLEVGSAELVGAYHVEAETSFVPGATAVFQSAEQRVRIPELRLEWVDEIPPLSPGQGLRIGRGMAGRSIRIIKLLDGTPDPCWWWKARPQDLTLTTSDEQKVRFPLSQFLRGECMDPWVQPEGLALTDPGVPVELNVQATNHTIGLPLQVEVVEPILAFDSLALVRPPGDSEDGFHLRWWIDGSAGQEYVSPHTQQTVEVVLTERNPPNVVSGLYVDPKAPSPGAQIELTMNAFNSESQWGYIGATTGEGQYTVAATVNGYASVEAEVDVQIFAPAAEPALRLHPVRRSAHIGAGLVADPDELVLELRGRQGPATLRRDLRLSVTCAASSLCSGPSSLTLRAGESRIAVPLRGLAPGATTLIVSAEDVALAEPVDVHVHVPQLRIKPADPHARDPDQPVGLRVYAYVLKAQQPIQASAQAWRVDLRTELPEAVLSTDHVVIPAGALESDVVWLRTGGRAGLRVHASRAGALSGSSSLPPGGRP